MKKFCTIPELLIMVILLLSLAACSKTDNKPIELPDDSTVSIIDDSATDAALDIDKSTVTSETAAQSEPTVNNAELTEVQTGSVTNDSEVQQEPVSENISDSVDLSEFHAILTGEADFLDAYSQNAVNISNLSSVFTTDPSIDAVAETFTVFDLDSDGTPEVILQLGPNETWGFLILHKKSDEIYGYWIPSRTFNSLKEDGTFTFSSGAGDSGIGKLTFGDQTYNIEELARSQTSFTEDGERVVSFFVNGQPSTREAFDQESDQQNRKKAATVYEYNDANISLYFDN